MSPAENEQRARPARGRARPFLGPWLAAAVAAICFANSISNDFTYDDKYIVRDNPRIRALTDFRAIWLSDWWQPHGREALIPRPNRDRLYRPLTLFTFALNYAVGGLRPIGYHLVNVALHAVICLLVWRLTQRLFADVAVSTCAALLFAVHPVHSEAVANVVGRAEMLSALFLLLGLLLLLPAAGKPGLRRGLLAAGAFLAGLLAKETAVSYPALALIVLLAVVRPRARPRARWWLMHALVLLLPLAVYLPLRYVALEHHLLRTRLTRSLFNPLRNADVGARLTGALTILGHYTRLLVVPSRLSCDYGLAIVDPQAGPGAITLLGAAAATGVVLLLGYRAPPSSAWRRLAVLAALTAASYALISNTVLLIGVSLAERLMYWPSVPILMLIAVAVMALWRGACAAGRALHGVAGLLRVCGVLLLVALGLRSVVRNTDWASNERLFLTDVATYPQGAHLNASAAKALIERATRIRDQAARARVLASAEQYLIRALRLYPRYPDALQDRGRVRAMLGDRAGAAIYFESALLLDPHDSVSKQLLATLGGELPRKQERLDELLRQIGEHPDDVAARVEAGRLLIELGRQAEALEHLAHAVRIAPDNVAALRLYGQALILHHKRAEAIDTYRRVLALNPDDWEAHTQLVDLLAERQPAAALKHAREAYRLRPDDLQTNINLAEAYAVNQQYDLALRRFRYVLERSQLKPPFERALRDRVRELERQAADRR